MVRGYYLSCLTLAEQKSVGKWEQKYRVYFRKHKRELYNAFHSKGILDEHVATINRQALELFERLVEQITTQQSIMERLKAYDQMACVSAMNHVRSIAEKTVLNDLTYC